MNLFKFQKLNSKERKASPTAGVTAIGIAMLLLWLDPKFGLLGIVLVFFGLLWILRGIAGKGY